MTRPARILLALPLCALWAGPAAAASFFEFDLRATFSGVEIDDTPIGGQFVLTGNTTTALSGTPWDDNPVSAPVDLSSLLLTYNGAAIGATLYGGPWNYGMGGTNVSNSPQTLEFRLSGGDIGIGVATIPDSIVFQTDDFGIRTWVGFGGGVGDGGRNWGITIAQDDDGVVRFGDGELLQRLGAIDPANIRTATLVTPTAAPIPLPAAGWMLLAGLAGLALTATRRRA